MSAQGFSEKLSGPPSDELERYRSISGLAIASLLLGVSSAAALVHPAAWIIPLAALVCSIAAQIRISRRRDALSGRNVAIAGMALALFFGVYASSRFASRQWILTRQAQTFVEDWLASVGGGRLEAAHQATLEYFLRQPDGTLLAEYYQNNPDSLNAMQKFFSDGIAQQLVEWGDKGQLRFDRRVGLFSEPQADYVTLRYFVSKPDDTEGLHLQIQTLRQTRDDGFYWTLLSVDDARVIDRRPF